MADLIAERIKHDLSWRGVESSVWHGLASARVELATERLSVATVAQARRKARFVAMVCSIAGGASSDSNVAPERQLEGS
jgi:hypothetical protein